MQKDKIIIIGAGLCGTLLALRMAQRGYAVRLYEKRPDMRLAEQIGGRSINLALSNRGLLALDRVGLKEAMKALCIPMHGRMIHPLGGDSFLSRYSGRDEDYINSISREGLNIALLEAADAFDHLEVRFEVSCRQVDLDNARVELEDSKTGETFSDEGALVIGTDGAGSVVRRALMGRTTALLFNFSQNFLRYGYKELTIQPTDNDQWRIEKHALHIWPRQNYMTIALPNLDGSFTVTMFHPYEGEAGFNTLNSPEKLEAFFEQTYPGLIKEMPHYVDDYFANPTGVLGTIRCYPWQAYGKVLIMGDAAHAIVPFYGQGMNAAFEDVRVFDDVLETYGGDWSKVLPLFQDIRQENADAIADLALDNFVEMRDKVDDQDFKKKRQLEMQLEQQFPEYYSKYSMVTFRPDLAYSKAMRLGRAQDELLLRMVRAQDPATLELGAVYERLRKINE